VSRSLRVQLTVTYPKILPKGVSPDFPSLGLFRSRHACRLGIPDESSTWCMRSTGLGHELLRHPRRLQSIKKKSFKRDRPRGPSPPTPPGIRITYQGDSVDCFGIAADRGFGILCPHEHHSFEQLRFRQLYSHCTKGLLTTSTVRAFSLLISGSACLLLRLSALECLTSFACHKTYYALC
jgi:hypothetical protein